MAVFDYLVIAGAVTSGLAVLTWALGPRWPLAAVLCSPLWLLLDAIMSERRPRWDGTRSAAMLWNVALVLLLVGGAGKLLQHL